MIKDIFTAIQTKITTDVPLVRWVDFDLGQYDDELPSVSFPAVLVDFTNSTFFNLGQGAAIGTQLLSIRAGFKVRERTHSVAKPAFKAVGLAHLDILEDIKKALKGLSGANFNGLVFLSESNEQREDYRIYTLSYECTVFSSPASPYIPYNSITNPSPLPPLKPCIHIVPPSPSPP
jgi:hypothetical protein